MVALSRKYRVGFFVAVITLLPMGGHCAERYFVTLSTTKVRPLALGGAFMAVKDGLPAFNYNPAAFELYSFEKKFRLTFHLNPILPVVALADYQTLIKDGKFGLVDFLTCLGLLFKSITISTEFFDTGFLFYDESLRHFSRFKSGKIFDCSGFLDNNSSVFLFKLKLARRVQIGATGGIFLAKDRGKRRWGWGSSYGVLLQPSERLNVGVVYFDLPQKLGDFRTNLERLEDETINIGTACKLDQNTTFTLDVRNLTEEYKKASREVHLGFERIFFSHLALRAGYYRKKISKSEVFSFGVGILDNNRFTSLENQFAHPNYFLNYSFILEKSPQGDRQWHFLSLIFRI